MIDDLLTKGTDNKGNPLTPEQKHGLMVQGMAIGKQVLDSMAKVSEIKERVQKIHAATSSVLDAEDVDMLVKQIVRILFNICGSQYQHIAEKFEQEIAETVRITTNVERQQGTLMSPDKAIALMAQTIVSAPTPALPSPQ
jgi:DNA-directed RNA polymerase beta subunit